MSLRSFGLSAFLLSSSLFLTGCGMGTPASSAPNLTPLGKITGRVFGGRAPIAGAHLYVYAAATTAVGAGTVAGNQLGGYGGAGIPASADNASVSLLTAHSQGIFPTAVDANGHYYVTTDANGNFSLQDSSASNPNEYTCTPGQQVYLYSSGGDTGSGTPNPAATLMAILGTCPASGTMASVTPLVYVSELTTVAAAYAMAGFATDPLHVGDDEGATPTARQTLAKTGLANAFANANQLVDIAVPAVGTSARTTTPSGFGAVPQTTIDALANSLAACVNTTGAGSASCTTLLGAATDSATGTGNPAADTAAAAINLAHFPGQNVAAVFAANTGISAPYLPTLRAAPNDWSVGIFFSGGGIIIPSAIAVDATGNVWDADRFSGLVKISSLGVVSGAITGNGINILTGVAVDRNGNIWVSNQQNYTSVLEFTNAGVPLSGPSGYTAGGNRTQDDNGIAIDGRGNVWVAENDDVAELSSTGAAISGASGYQTTGQVGREMAIDGSGNAWTTVNFSLNEFNSSGTLLSGGGYSFPGPGIPDDKIGNVLAADSGGHMWAATRSTPELFRFSQAGVSTAFTGGGLGTGNALAIDGAGNLWVANQEGRVSEFTNAGTAVTGSNGYNGSGFLDAPISIAVDGSGNVWVANGDQSNNYYGVVELLGASAPVITPICAGLPSTPTTDGSSSLGTRP